VPYNAHLHSISYKKVIHITYSALYSTNSNQNNMTTERIKEIQLETAYPESLSVQQALLKVWNECEQAKQQQLDLTNINRLEVINHASNSHPIGRVLTMYEKTGDFTVVDAEFQDDGKTLKIFIS
jgi:hypothetical protein